MPGTTIRYDIPIRYAKAVVVQLRGVNSIQIAGPWSVAAHTSRDAPTGAVGGVNSLANPTFQASPIRPRRLASLRWKSRIGWAARQKFLQVAFNPMALCGHGTGVTRGWGCISDLVPISSCSQVGLYRGVDLGGGPRSYCRLRHHDFSPLPILTLFNVGGRSDRFPNPQGGTTISRTYSEWIPDMGTNVNNALFEAGACFRQRSRWCLFDPVPVFHAGCSVHHHQNADIFPFPVPRAGLTESNDNARLDSDSRWYLCHDLNTRINPPPPKGHESVALFFCHNRKT